MKRILTGGLFALSAVLSTASADDTDWAPTTFSLDNGMVVVVVPDHRAPVVTHMVWYKVGAVDEASGKSGLAHLFEHIMFKETDDLGPGEFDDIVSRNGGVTRGAGRWAATRRAAVNMPSSPLASAQARPPSARSSLSVNSISIAGPEDDASS